MRFKGHNVLAILVAALAIYGVGFLIYGVLFEAAWIAGSGYDEDQLRSGMSKMPIGFIIPILLASGLSLLIRWRDRPGAIEGALAGAFVAFFFLSAQLLYGYVYSPAGGEVVLGIDVLHAFAGMIVGGTILGAWR